MNELFAADPATCADSRDLNLLLKSFGPCSGRYLANYPLDWDKRLTDRLESLGELEGAKVRTLLRRAHESMSLVTRMQLPWREDIDWLGNANPLLSSTPIVFSGLVANQSIPPSVHQLHELDLSPTADERIAATASEYVRISKILLILSPEVALIDPFLNPLKRSYAGVLEAFFSTIALGKCQKVSLWARASEVFGTRSSALIKSDLTMVLQSLAKKVRLKPGCKIEMFLVGDERQRDKMHGRYLLSIKGGIRFDQGFQQLSEGRVVDVGPVGKTVHNDLLDVYFDGKHDMSVVEKLMLKV